MATHIDLGVALSLNWARRDHKFGSSRILLQNRDGFFRLRSAHTEIRRLPNLAVS